MSVNAENNLTAWVTTKPNARPRTVMPHSGQARQSHAPEKLHPVEPCAPRKGVPVPARAVLQVVIPTAAKSKGMGQTARKHQSNVREGSKQDTNSKDDSSRRAAGSKDRAARGNHNRAADTFTSPCVQKGWPEPGPGSATGKAAREPVNPAQWQHASL